MFCLRYKAHFWSVLISGKHGAVHSAVAWMARVDLGGSTRSFGIFDLATTRRREARQIKTAVFVIVWARRIAKSLHALKAY
jgi:nucleoid DNA-binding protein